MKRFEFSLDRMLKIKRQRQRLAELEQQRARVKVDTAKSRIEELQNQLGRLSENLIAWVGQTMTPHHWVSSYDMSQQIGQALVEAEKEVVSAENFYWEKVEERASIATEVEALQTLRKQKWDLFRQECMQADQARLDEIGMQRWQRHVPAEQTHE